MSADGRELTIALGPVGLAGLALLVLGLLRRRPVVGAAGVAALAADATVPRLGGLAARHGDRS